MKEILMAHRRAAMMTVRGDRLDMLRQVKAERESNASHAAWWKTPECLPALKVNHESTETSAEDR